LDEYHLSTSKFEVFNERENDVSFLARHRMAMRRDIHSELESNINMPEKLMWNRSEERLSEAAWMLLLLSSLIPYGKTKQRFGLRWTRESIQTIFSYETNDS
jgi:hypothetical protein